MAENKLPEIDLTIDAGSWSDEPLLLQKVNGAIGAAISVADLCYAHSAELSILLTNDAGVQKLNLQWRNIDKPTNVLSFPADDIEVGEGAGMLLGDIVMGWDTLAREAKDEGISFDDHFSHLVVHGFLHLFGYDHQNDADAEIMEQIEREALAKLGIADPY
ncbi:MAG: rRNA maturation RNase YbeY [Rhizobiaceae bacterium]